MTFAENFARKIPANQVVAVDGLAYVSWANILRGGGMPRHTCVTFNGKPGLQVFGGVVVAVDMEIPGGAFQRTWLPVLDEENIAVAARAAAGGTLSLIQSAISRCRAKAVGMVTGYGLSLYAGYAGDGEAFAKDLGVLATDLTPLQDIKPLAEKKGDSGPEYLRWASALAAAKIRDERFVWEVEFYDDKNGVPQPYMEAGKGFFVAVSSTFMGVKHTEVLPIMDIWSYEPLTEPKADDWNRAVMRALAKGIAVQTGYGISLYTMDEPILEGHEPPSAEDLALLEKTILAKKRTVKDLLNWLGVEGEDLSVLTKDQCERSLKAVNAKRPEATAATAEAAAAKAISNAKAEPEAKGAPKAKAAA